MILGLTIFNSVAFFTYGFLCIFTKHMVDEFEEFGLRKCRIMTGVLEICGAAGSIIGYYWNSYLYIFSTSGLMFLVILGIHSRLRVKQPLKQSFQAATFLFLNAFLSYKQILIEFFKKVRVWRLFSFFIHSLLKFIS